MKRFRSIIVGLLVVSAVSAIVLASAGAEEPKKCGVASPTHWAYCYGASNEEVSGVQDASGTGGTAKLVADIGGAEAKFECTSTSILEEFEAGGKHGGRLKLFGCKETNPAHCVLTEAEEEEIQLLFKGSLTGKLEKPGKPEATMAGTGGAEEIGKITIQHSNTECPIPAEAYKVDGKQYVEIKNPEEALTEHELVATKANSDFKVGENSASLEGADKVKLTGSHEGATWYIGEGD